MITGMGLNVTLKIVLLGKIEIKYPVLPKFHKSRGDYLHNNCSPFF